MISGYVTEEEGGAETDWAARANRLLARYGARDLPLRHYTKDLLMSADDQPSTVSGPDACSWAAGAWSWTARKMRFSIESPARSHRLSGFSYQCGAPASGMPAGPERSGSWRMRREGRTRDSGGSSPTLR